MAEEFKDLLAKPFVQSDLASWLAVFVGLVALVAAYKALRRPVSHFSGGMSKNISLVSPGVFQIEFSCFVTTLAASYVIKSVECYVVLGGLRVRGIGVGGTKQHPKAEIIPNNRLVFAGGELKVRFLLPVEPNDHNRGSGHVRIRLTDGSRKTFPLRLNNLKKYA